ncbi:hypothetical protein SJ359_22410 [Raoultella ornithinolytica]|uniref:hypothetical protein n=1 Tax=Raoultella ornithinolytica TaxID=54291 RepID=UPI0029D8FDE6|nr:hypothetical protein [Raoultella ornithinolytica]MDX7499979.1 hypothetical protein [Raoultella ornithinolytica]
MRSYCVAVSLLTVSFICAAEEIPAPVGLKWGESEQTITSKYGGIPVNPVNGFNVYVIYNPPIKLDGIEHVVGLVAPNIGLVKVILASDIANDAYGIEGDKIYNDYKKKLTVKYGKPESFDYMGRKVYSEPDEFYQCLKYDGCGRRVSFFTQKDGGSISLEITGKSRGTGMFRISYEGRLFSEAQKIAEQESDKRDEAGL